MNCPSCGATLPREEMECARCGAHVGWWIRLRAGQERGPFTFLEVQPMIRQGKLGPADSIRVGLIGPWIPAPEVLSPTFGQQQEREEPPQPRHRRVPKVRPQFLIVACLSALAVAGIAVGFHRLAQTPAATSPRRLCEGNLALLTRGISLYAEDYDGRLPEWHFWPDVTHPYVHSRAAYDCPMANDGERGYDYNAALGNTPMDQVPDARDCILLWDAGALGPSSGIPSGYGPPRHDGGDNYGYLDGHVAWRQRGGYSDLPGIPPKW